MQQLQRVAQFPTHNGATRKSLAALHPVLAYGLLFGGLSGLFAILQLAVSVSSAVENRSAFASVYYGLQNNGFDIGVIGQWLGPVLAATYTSCLVAFGLSMWLAWYAGRASAIATRSRTVGALAGMLTSSVGSLIWIVASVIVVAVARIDGSISGILTATAVRPASPNGGEILGLVGQEGIAALIAVGFAAVAGRMGAATAPLPHEAAPGNGRAPLPPGSYIAYGPYLGMPMPPQAPALIPPPARPFVVAPMYPPPPEFYRAQQQAAPNGSLPAPGYPGWPGYLPTTAYPVHPMYPGYPPTSWAPPPGITSPPPSVPASGNGVVPSGGDHAETEPQTPPDAPPA